MRVRLLNPILLTVARIDPASTRIADPPGPDVSGYDDVWRSPNLYVDPADGQRKSPVATDTITFKAQVSSISIGKNRRL